MFLVLLLASQYRDTQDNGLDGLDTSRSQLSIQQGLATSEENFEYGPGEERHARGIIHGNVPGFARQVLRATSQIESPLHSQSDQDVYPSSIAEEGLMKISDGPAKNEKPLNQPRQEESRLLGHLLTNYDKRVRPIRDPSKNITIYVGLTLTQIFDMVSM